MKTGRYRVRRGLFGKAILQAEYDEPYCNPMTKEADTRVRELMWADCPFQKAPAELMEKPK